MKCLRFQLIRYAGIRSRIWLMLVTMSIKPLVGRCNGPWSRVLTWLLPIGEPASLDDMIRSHGAPWTCNQSGLPFALCELPSISLCDLDAVDRLTRPEPFNPARRCAAQPQRVVLLEDNPANVWSNNALTSFSKATVMCRIVQASPEQSLFSYFTDVERYGPELTSFLKGRLVFLVRSLHLHI